MVFNASVSHSVSNDWVDAVICAAAALNVIIVGVDDNVASVDLNLF